MCERNLKQNTVSRRVLQPRFVAVRSYRRMRIAWMVMALVPCVAAARGASGTEPATGPAGAGAVTTQPSGLHPASDAAIATDRAIRYLTDRAKREPDNFAVQNKLAGYLLLRARETESSEDLQFAKRAALASLAAVGAEQNRSGLSALVQVELASHEFAAATKDASRLIKLDPSKIESYALLADALLELGDYERAEETLRQLQAREVDEVTFTGETRRARIASLRGKTDAAREHLFTALALALEASVPSPQPVAWCHWQLGETDFACGRYEAAEKHYASALDVSPKYAPVLGSMARVLAARGDRIGAIKRYEQAVQLIRDPIFFAALGDLHQLAGRKMDANQQYALVHACFQEKGADDAAHNREKAMFDADHDLAPGAAYEAASREYKDRRDIYGADVVAWTALKAGKLPEAQVAMKDALRLGTKDARLLYHAGMIARAVGDRQQAREHLHAALALNPQFDPLQATLAVKALEELNREATASAPTR
ncbi:MAG: tetratricopeptide repeat protein [Planctomycetota bacterium]|nr:tetratricopeptide repeat protein [Planctomycetota bacterium]